MSYYGFYPFCAEDIRARILYSTNINHPIGKNINSLEKKFCHLSSSVQDELNKKSIKVDLIRKHIFSLPYQLKREASNLVSEHAQSIRKKSDDLDRLFVYLDGTLWNFIDYQLLEHIIKEFGSSELKDKMSEYVSDLTQFQKSTTISQLIDNWPGRKEMPPLYSEVKAEIGLNPDLCTLEDLNKLRQELSNFFLPPLSDYALLHFRFSRGSVIVSWILPFDLVPKLTNAICKPESSSFFEIHAIEWLSIREIPIYPLSLHNVKLQIPGTV